MAEGSDVVIPVCGAFMPDTGWPPKPSAPALVRLSAAALPAVDWLPDAARATSGRPAGLLGGLTEVVSDVPPVVGPIVLTALLEEAPAALPVRPAAAVEPRGASLQADVTAASMIVQAISVTVPRCELSK